MGRSLTFVTILTTLVCMLFGTPYIIPTFLSIFCNCFLYLLYIDLHSEFYVCTKYQRIYFTDTITSEANYTSIKNNYKKLKGK